MSSPSPREGISLASVTVAVALALVTSACGSEQERAEGFQVPELRRVASIGERDGSEAPALGEIRDLEVDDRGRVYVLDDGIRRFGPEGEPSGRITLRVGAPEEIRDPVDIELDSAGDLHVLDRPKNRLSVFDVGTEGFSHQESVTLSTSIREFCELGGERYAAWPAEGGLLHRLGPDGDFVESFGPTLSFPGEETLDATAARIARYRANVGPMLCIEKPDLVLLAAGSLPYLRMFDTTGTELWVDALDDYHPTRWSQEGSNLNGGPVGENGHHFARSLVRWSDGVVLLQLEHRFPGREHPDRQFYELESRFISLGDFRELARSDSLPWIRAVRGDSAYAVKNVPYPRVEIYER